MRRVLLTGASGFAGRHALPWLMTGGDQIHTTSRHAMPEVAGVTHHVADLLDPAQAARLVTEVEPTHLLHLGWNATPGKFWSADDNLDWVASSLAMYRAFVAGGGQRFVAAGTCAEYDWSHAELSESTTPIQPATLYGKSKAALRSLIEQSAIQSKTSFAWGRLFFLYGPHEQSGRLVSDVIRALLANRSIPCSSGVQQRDFMHIADAGHAFVQLLHSEVQGAVNIASGACVPLKHILQRIGELTGRPSLIDLGARPAVPGDPPRMAANVSRLRDEVGFRPQFDLDSGLTDTIAWWRASGVIA